MDAVLNASLDKLGFPALWIQSGSEIAAIKEALLKTPQTTKGK